MLRSVAVVVAVVVFVGVGKWLLLVVLLFILILKLGMLIFLGVIVSVFATPAIVAASAAHVSDLSECNGACLCLFLFELQEE